MERDVWEPTEVGLLDRGILNPGHMIKPIAISYIPVASEVKCGR
jgi:hypothetical protein